MVKQGPELALCAARSDPHGLPAVPVSIPENHQAGSGQGRGEDSPDCFGGHSETLRGTGKNIKTSLDMF